MQPTFNNEGSFAGPLCEDEKKEEDEEGPAREDDDDVEDEDRDGLLEQCGHTVSRSSHVRMSSDVMGARLQRNVTTVFDATWTKATTPPRLPNTTKS